MFPMGTNYYAKIRTSDNGGNVFVHTMHICKTGWTAEAGSGVGTMNGQHFPNIKTWVNFIRENSKTLTVEDEYGTTINTETFIKDILLNPAPTSARQIEWLTNNLYRVFSTPQPPKNGAHHWIDKDTGKLFYNSEFC